MTVAQLSRVISSEEFEQWKVFWGWRKQWEEVNSNG